METYYRRPKPLKAYQITEDNIGKLIDQNNGEHDVIKVGNWVIELENGCWQIIDETKFHKRYAKWTKEKMK